MNYQLKKTLLAAILGTSCALAAAPAMSADFGVSFNGGGVAFGYRDGYWDRYHRWHRWHDRDEWNWYRAHYANNYYDWDHDRDRDNGWHRGWYHRDNGGDYDRDYGRHDYDNGQNQDHY